MKANELRIDNWVLPPESPFEPIQVTLKGLIHYGDDFMPIPLTEKWFLKFGPEKQLYEDDGPDYYLVIRRKKFDIIFEDENNIFLDICEETFHLKYVHELQNMYYALTGEEIKLNQ